MSSIQTLPRLLVTSLALASMVACSSSEGPRFEPMEHQVAAVGEELVLELLASNDDGSSISYAYDSDAPNLGDNVSLTQRPGGAAVFAWTPSADDLGSWTFDFHAIDAHGTSTESITIEVRSAIGSQTLPQFRRPLGAGTALNTAKEDCVEIEILIQDQDTADVKLDQAEPRIEGAELIALSGESAMWRWCPTETQRASQDRYMLTLTADDGDNPKAIKRYQIVLRDESARPECGGTLPVITHVPDDLHRGVSALEITATIEDDRGLKGAPFLYYSTDKPSEPPDFSAMTQLPFRRAAGAGPGDPWTVRVPNPIARDGAGASSTVYYAIVAEDNDDQGGGCDHVASAIFQAQVENPEGETGGAALCEACTADAQCGDVDDLCLGVGVEGESFCFQSCDGAGSCPTGYICSPAAMTSDEGNSARQCIPVSESCTGGPSCTDDGFEQNDGKSQATRVEPGVQAGLAMCPLKDFGGDEDWYRIEVTEDSQVDIRLQFPSGLDSPLPTYPDLNMRLVDDAGRVIAVSENAIDPYQTDIQKVTRCLTPGTYYVRVYSYFSGSHAYDLSYTTSASTCSAGTCTDDVYENDDGLADARTPSFESGPVFSQQGNQICSLDDDWYYVYLFDSDTLYISASFEQSGPSGDLDILIYDGIGTLITQCTEEDASGCSANGQSGTSNEYMVYSPADFGAEPGDTYVVIHGFNGSENAYDMCIALEPGHCEL